MGLMAGIAGDPAGVIRSYDLRESPWLSAVGFMAAGADDGRVQLWRSHRRRIVGMLGQASMASLAGNHHMLALLLLLDDVGMASFAGIVSGKSNGMGCRLCDSSAAVVAVLPKATRHHRNSQNEEYCQQHYDDNGQPDKMFYVLEQVLSPVPASGVILSTNRRIISILQGFTANDD